MWDELRSATWAERLRFAVWTIGGTAAAVALPWLMWAVIA